MARRYGKKLKAQIDEIVKNPELVLEMTTEEYGIFRQRFYKSPEFYRKMPKTVVDVSTGQRYLLRK